MRNVIAKIPAVKDGEVFSVGGVEFIKFSEANGTVPAVAKNIIFNSCFGDDNDLRSSNVLKKLMYDFLPRIIEAVGTEGLCVVKTDLTTLGGLKTYGMMESLVSLPTFDFYRANVEIFDKYPVMNWWWLATPDSARPHDAPTWVTCVAPSGRIRSGLCYCGGIGVRPFLSFNSSIFESSAE